MRTTQYMGLHPQGNKWVEKYCHPDPIPTKKTIDGMFGEQVHQLQKYRLLKPETIIKNPKSPQYLETHAEEFLQADPWSSGPVLFIALRYSKCKQPITESLWPESDIENC